MRIVTVSREGKLLHSASCGLDHFAMTRTPGLPGVARAFLMRSSSSGAGRPSCLPSLLARASPARPLEFGEHAHHLKHRLARRCPGVEALLVQECPLV